MSESWVIVSDYPEYSVSSDGRVRRDVGGAGKTAGRILRPSVVSSGYLCVRLFNNGASLTLLVHRLVCRAFRGDPSPGSVVRHLNGDKADNRAENLRWGTPKENAADTKALDRQVYGDRCRQSKLTPEAVVAIRRQAETRTYKQLGREYGVSDQAIYRVVVGKSWSHVQ